MQARRLARHASAASAIRWQWPHSNVRPDSVVQVVRPGARPLATLAGNQSAFTVTVPAWQCQPSDSLGAPATARLDARAAFMVSRQCAPGPRRPEGRRLTRPGTHSLRPGTNVTRDDGGGRRSGRWRPAHWHDSSIKSAPSADKRSVPHPGRLSSLSI